MKSACIKNSTARLASILGIMQRKLWLRHSSLQLTQFVLNFPFVVIALFLLHSQQGTVAYQKRASLARVSNDIPQASSSSRIIQEGT